MAEFEIRQQFIDSFLTSMNGGHNILNIPEIMSLLKFEQGRWDFKNDDFFENYGMLVIEYLFLYGAVVITDINNVRVPIPAINIKRNARYDIIKCIVNFHIDQEQPITKTIINGKNGVILKNNLHSYPSLIFYLNYLQLLSINYQAVKINEIRSINKENYIIDKKTSDNIIREVQQLKFGNSWCNFIRTKDGVNPFERLENGEIQNEQMDLWSSRNNIRNELYFQLGYKTNISEKIAQNTNSEVETNHARFDNIDNVDKIQMNYNLKMYNNFFKTNASVEINDKFEDKEGDNNVANKNI